MNDLYSIAGEFFPGERISEITSFGTGQINDTYRMVISGAESETYYLLQKLNTDIFRKPEKVMANILKVYEHLTGFPDQRCLLRPIADRRGKLLFRTASGYYWRVFPFFSDTISTDRADSPQRAFQAARAIGKFLNHLFSLDPRNIQVTIPHFHDPMGRLQFFEELIARPASRLSRVRREIECIMDHRDIFQQVHELDLPQRVVHNDTKISNVLFHVRSGEACGLIDWDTIMPGTILSDFGDMVRSMVSPVVEDSPDIELVTLRMPFFSAICRGFLSEVREDAAPVELNHLRLGALWITLEQAMRFLTDYLMEDAYYKVKYPAHNRVRTKNQLALFLSMWARRKEMQKVIDTYL